VKDSNRTVIACVALAVLAGAFWLLALSPKRQEAADLSNQVDQLRAQVAAKQQEAAAAAAAKRGFPNDYRRLVLLGKAVPGGDDTASLLVQLNKIAGGSGVQFRSIELNGATDAAAATAPTAPTPTAGSAPVSATEAAASVLPIGASVGSAGLGVMPYKLTFRGGFFQTADFLKGLDRLVQTKSGEVAANGRLVTIDGFSIVPDQNLGFPHLDASFSVTTYIVPPTQGVTAGASPTAPAPSTAVPTSTTTAP
jgi:Tfp pilus assembly protein PilO